MSVSELLRVIGLDHLNPDRNSKADVEKHFRDYIRSNRNMSEDQMKVLVSLREEWKEKFDPDYGPKEFEMEHEEEERFRASQRYAADTISGMLNEDARRDSARASKGKNKMDEPSGSGGGYASSSTRPDGEGDPAWSKWKPTGTGVWGSDAQNEDEADGREEHARQNDACPSWPHIAPKQLRTYRKNLRKAGCRNISFCFAAGSSALTAV